MLEKKILYLLVVLGFMTGPVISQDRMSDWDRLKQLNEGTVIAVETFDGRRIQGQFERASSKLLSVTVDPGSMLEVQKEEVRQVKKLRSRSMGKSILIGSAIGLGIGLLTGALIESGSSGEDKGIATAGLAYAGAGLGAAGGALDALSKWSIMYEATTK